ncbi:MAG TPA: hypothetical protein VFX76_16970 [Roseiflexaceae bacterium]|nr:hypothetical protein [Roseiflexaceae bacterium]
MKVGVREGLRPSRTFPWGFSPHIYMLYPQYGDVRIAWMDTRVNGTTWNTYYRSTTNGGGNWSAEIDISTPVQGIPYITPEGFSYPFGDYFEIAVDDRGTAHAVWGEGLNYDAPGSICMRAADDRFRADRFRRQSTRPSRS